jgi:hypothetical protein
MQKPIAETYLERVGRSEGMIVRKYCERKRREASISGKRKNKKDLMNEYRSEVADEDWYQCGTP